MENDRQHNSIFKPGEKIKYTKTPIRMCTAFGPVDDACDDNAEEYFLRNSEETILPSVLGRGRDEIYADVPVPVLDETRASPNCIISGQLELPVGESFDWQQHRLGRSGYADSAGEEKINATLLAGLAYSKFYNGLHQKAKKDVHYVNMKLPENKVFLTTTFLQLECAAYLSESKGIIVGALNTFERVFRTQPDIHLLLTLALELKHNRRYYGAIMACRVAGHVVSNDDKSGSCGFMFRFLYAMMLEMSLRALNVLGNNWYGNEVVIRCMNGVVNEMVKISGSGRIEDEGRQAVSPLEQVKLIAGCRNAIAFCCNSVGMYVPAYLSGASRGLREVEKFGHESLRQRKIYPDLMVNTGVSFVGRNVLSRAKYFFDTAAHTYQHCGDLKSDEKKEDRCSRARRNATVTHELLSEVDN